jgi:hypothetical protein
MTQSGEYVFFITTREINNHDQTKAEKQSAVFEAHNTFVSIRM